MPGSNSNSMNVPSEEDVKKKRQANPSMLHDDSVQETSANPSMLHDDRAKETPTTSPLQQSPRENDPPVVHTYTPEAGPLRHDVPTTPTAAPRFSDIDKMQLANYDEMIKILQKQRDENPVETPEQRKKRERREKWAGIISGISDAASAISNLITTSNYAPDMYDSNNSLSKATQSRFDKAKAERDEKLRQHLHYAMNINKLKLKKAADMKQMEADKLARAKADAQQKRDDDLFNLQLDVLRGKKDEQEAKADKARIDADYAEALNQAEIARRKGAANRSQGAANLSNAKATNVRKGISLSGNGMFRAFDRNDKEHYFKKYEEAESFSKQEGTWNEGKPYTETTEIVKETPRGTETETKTYTKQGKGYSQKSKPPKGKGYGSANSKKSDSGGSFYD